MSKWKIAWCWPGFGVLLMAPGAVFATNGYFSSGYGVAQRAMGGAGTTLVEDALVVAVNPANMVWVDDQFDFNLTDIIAKRGYAASARGSGAGEGIFTLDPIDDHVSRRGRFYVPGFGYKQHIDDVSAWGVALYANGGLNDTYKTGTATFAQDTPLLQAHCDGALGGGAPTGATDVLGFCGNGKSSLTVDVEQLFLVPSYSRKIGTRSSIGIAPILAAQQIKITGLGAFKRFSNDPINVTDKGYSRSYGGGLRVGFLTEPIDGVSFGASYQMRLQMTKFKRYRGLFAQGGEFDVPETWNVGLGFAPTHDQKIAIDFQRIYFHQVKSVGNRLDANDFVNNCAAPRLFGTTASNPYCLGGDSGPGFGWRDVSVLKIGYQIRFADFMFRLGYSHGKQPVQSDQVLFNILAPATLERDFTGGISYRISETLSLDTAFVYEPDSRLTGKNPLSNTSANVAQLIATGVLPGGKVATANAFGPDPNDQDLTIHLGGRQFTVGLSYHF